MNATRSSSELSGAAALSVGAVSLGDFAPQLRDMLADEDWRSACQNYEELEALAEKLAADPDFGRQPPPAGLPILAASYADFCRFRRSLAAALNTPDDQPLHVTPEEWLQHRLRHYGEATDEHASFADYRLHRDRFRVS